MELLTQTIRYTRAYEFGLVFAADLSKELEERKAQIAQGKYERHLEMIYCFIFSNLDRLDRWEDYLDLWEKVLHNVQVGNRYSSANREEGMRSYIIRDEGDAIYVHFLWGLRHRKAVVERKIGKKRDGKRFDYLLHAQQSDLTPEEVRERFDWIVNFRTTGTYDFNPPASRHWETRREKKKKTTNVEPLDREPTT